MFSINHFLWLGICAILVGLIIHYLKKNRPSLEKVLTCGCIISILSEFIKVFSVIELVPATSGSTMHLYIPMNHLPLHLCSIQILFLFYTRFSQNEKMKENILVFMYPSCIIGAILALIIPTIFQTSISAAEAFIHPLAYQFFLFHTMLIVVGIYIPMSKEVVIKEKHFWTSLAIIGFMGFISIYLNSMFAAPTYVNNQLISVDFSPNFFFTQRTPIGIKLVEKWQWFLYLAIISALVILVLTLFYAPYIIKERKEKKNESIK